MINDYDYVILKKSHTTSVYASHRYHALTVTFMSFHPAIFPSLPEQWAKLLYGLLFHSHFMDGRVCGRTREFVRDPRAFSARLKWELSDALKQSISCGRQLIVRLNQSSDIPWEDQAFGRIPQSFPNVLFFDDTDDHRRLSRASENYHLFYRMNRSHQSTQRATALLDSGRCTSMLLTASARLFESTEDYARNSSPVYAEPRGVSIGGQLYSGFGGACELSRIVVSRHAKSAGRGAVAMITPYVKGYLEANAVRRSGLVVPLSET